MVVVGQELRDLWLGGRALVLTFASAHGSGIVTDFQNAFYPAAEAILEGVSPYPEVDDPQLAEGTEYVYPPLIALASTPFTVISDEAAGLVVGKLGTAVVHPHELE